MSGVFAQEESGMAAQAEVVVTRYPASMTGKKLRAKLGIEERIFAKADFRLRAKFRRIGKETRLRYLIRRAEAETGIRLSWVELRQMRQAFDAFKLRKFPMSETCPCYVCDGKASIRHHVTPLLKGGRNKQNNIVPLCNSCHEKVHPRMHE